MTASVHKSPGLFSVFWPFSIVLLFGWSPLILQLTNLSRPFNNPLVTVPIYTSYIIIIIIIIIYSLRVFHVSVADGFSLESESPQVSMTLLSILAVLNNAVVWMVSTCLPTSKSSSPFSNPFVTVPKAPISIGTIVTFMFHSFFNSQAKSWYLSIFSHYYYYFYYYYHHY